MLLLLTDCIKHAAVDMVLDVQDGVVTVITKSDNDDSKKKQFTCEENKAVGNDFASNSNVDHEGHEGFASSEDRLLLYYNHDIIIIIITIRAEGKIDKKVYLRYLEAMGGLKPFIFLVFVQTTWQCLSVGNNYDTILKIYNNDMIIIT